jgi:hypothetical protein
MADYAISNVPRRVVYAASGTGPYAFTFEILNQTDIAVYKASTLLTLTTDYTVTINANGTGSVTLVTSAGTSNITIVGAKNIQRTTDFTTGGDLFANTLNDELDNQTIFIQQVAETAERGLKAPVVDPTDINMTLPAKASRVGTVLAFNATTGNPEAGPSIGSVTTVAAQSANINTVATNIGSVNTVAGNNTNINTVAGVSGNVTTVAGSIANVNTVADDLNEGVSEINTVAVNIADVNSVGTNISNVNTVAGISANVTSVAGNASNINTVAGNNGNVTTVAGISGNVTTVAGISANVTTVAGINAAVSTVATNNANVSTVATNIAAVNTNATNIVAIQNASTNATNAATSATAAQTAQSAAESARDATLAAYDNFDDRYLGSKTSNPTLDNDGNALAAGALYFNSVSGAMQVYTGSAWVAAYVSGTGFLASANNLSDVASTSSARTNLGLAIGTNVQAYDAQLADIAALTPTDNSFIVGNGTNFVAEDASTARTSLGLGTIATQAANNVSITGGSVAGITDLAVADGGTGASTAANARTNLSAAASGANSDITSLTGLTTPLSQAQGGTGTTTGYYGFKNRIINGDMTFNQRGASNTSNGYALDRWVISAITGSKMTVAQSSDAPTGFSNSMLITSSAATTIGSSDYYDIGQRIEGFNTSDLMFGTANAQTVTVSFWAKSSLTGTFGGSLQNQASNRSYPFTFTINSANTWEYETITITGDTSGTWIGATNGTGMQLLFGLGIGTTYRGTANTWQGGYIFPTGAVNLLATNAATLQITGCQLEKGSAATSFDYLSYTTELQLCQRYYAKLGANPAAIGNPGYQAHGAGCNQATNTSQNLYLGFPQFMRTSPSIGYSGNIGITANGSYVTLSSISGAYTGVNSSLLQTTTPAVGSAGDGATLISNGDTSAFISLTAEL